MTLPENALERQIEDRRRTIKTDSYAMSIGELTNLYLSNELDIHPDFQRFFRWSDEQKSALIESILLGIPLPPIFVSQRDDGIWDVVDGLQRLSTIFELQGILRKEDQATQPRLVLRKTHYLSALEGMRWPIDSDHGEKQAYLSQAQVLDIRRAKLDMKIMLRSSDPMSKYDLFQRLNTNGSQLSDQEVRNCLLIMVDRDSYVALKELSGLPAFQSCIALTDKALQEQYDVELALRFLIFTSLKADSLKNVGDLNPFLSEQMIGYAERGELVTEIDRERFETTFRILNEALSDDVFRRYDPVRKRFAGGFLVSAFETVAAGVGYHYNAWDRKKKRIAALQERVRTLWTESEFANRQRSGVSAASRVVETIPLGRTHFKP